MEEAKQTFTIADDQTAEWALKKIKEAAEERDRLIGLADIEIEELVRVKEKAVKDYENETNYLKGLLMQYMDSRPCKATKTRATYQLCRGKLVRKFGGIAYERNDDVTLEWAKTNKPSAVKVKESLDWAGLKKELVPLEDGTVITADGEIVEGVRAYESADSFDIEFN